MPLKQFFDPFFQLIFWLWNLIFLLVVYVGILPWVGGPLWTATLQGIIPVDFFLTLVALIAIPVLGVAIGARCFLKQPLQLMRLFYGVEAPLILLCLTRLFLLRELPAASTQLIGTIVLCIAAFLIELLYGYLGQSEPQSRLTPDRVNQNSTVAVLQPSLADFAGRIVGRKSMAWLQMGCHSLMLVVGAYAAILLLFYAIPVGFTLIVEFFKFQWLGALWQSLQYDLITTFWWIPLFLILFVLTSSLFVIMPSLFGFLYLQSGKNLLLKFAAQYGKNAATLGAIGVLTAWLTIFMALQQQPQGEVFKLLDNPANTDQVRQTLLAKSEKIRGGLTHAYLSPYRYLSTVAENNHIAAMYQGVFHLPPEAAQFLQDSYNRLMSPFLYQGSHQDDKKAEKLYAEFFDMPLQKGEQSAVQHAVQSTWNQEEAKAGLLNINQEKVWLSSQAVTVTEQGDFANIELHEVYVNQTQDLQEVFYSFSLPESATITGLWLGDTDDLTKRFEFSVSPRGAAQAVYNSQVVVRRDPALIEQVGPRHYRLRVFPIPVRSLTRNSNTPQAMHLWLTYQVMRQPQGWQMPSLGEKRNIFWTKNTQRIFAGKEIKDSHNAATSTWLPAYLPAINQAAPMVHQITLSEGNVITAKPLTDADYTLPQGKKFALILDTSRSMATQRQAVTQTLEWLKTHILSDNDLDLYVTRSPGMAATFVEDVPSFHPHSLTFYGTLQIKQMIQQFTQLRGNHRYDAILLISDRGSYELSDDLKEVPTLSTPLWTVHLGELPPGYDDVTLKLIQGSGGGISTDAKEVMERLATTAKLGESVVSVVDGYAWSHLPSSPAKASATIQQPVATHLQDIAALAARQWVLAMSRNMGENNLSQLDKIHAIAKSFKIVTPYSSMIVLVNDEQRQLLKAAELANDRFDREVESGQEELTKPDNPLNVAAVPEPETWMLLIVGGILLMGIRLIKYNTRKVG